MIAFEEKVKYEADMTEYEEDKSRYERTTRDVQKGREESEKFEKDFKKFEKKGVVLYGLSQITYTSPPPRLISHIIMALATLPILRHHQGTIATPMLYWVSIKTHTHNSRTVHG